MPSVAVHLTERRKVSKRTCCRKFVEKAKKVARKAEELQKLEKIVAALVGGGVVCFLSKNRDKNRRRFIFICEKQLYYYFGFQLVQNSIPVLA